MPDAIASVPVTLPESWAGFGTSTGVLRLAPSELVIEYETVDGLLGAIRSGIQRRVVPFEAVESLTVVERWFGTHFELMVHTLEALQDFPGGAQPRIQLKVARRDRPAAHRLASEFQLVTAQQWMDRGKANLTAHPADPTPSQPIEPA